MTTVLELRGITKRFPGVLANDQINLTLEEGEIHTLLGENGAGKTTLMNILYGLYLPDEGEVFIHGQPVKFQSPSDAIHAGIGMVHQHFMLVPVFTVAENVMLGIESIKATFNLKKLYVALAASLVFSLLNFLISPVVHIIFGNPLFFFAFLYYIVVGLLCAPIGLGLFWVLAKTIGGFLNQTISANRIRQISEQYGLAVDPYTYVKDLPVGVQQRVEIIKLLYRNANILIFDEPTAVLTPQEADDLFMILRALVKEGKSIIFITHKLREVVEIADRITVLRLGKVVGTTRPEEADQKKLASMMVGRDVDLELRKLPCNLCDLVLEVADLVVADNRKQVMVDGVSFEVRGGEVLGVAGVQGNGQTELVESLTGLRTPAQGKITLLGHDISKATPREITELGSAHIPEDRQRDGLILPFPVMENLILNTYYLPPFARRNVINWNIALNQSDDLVQKFDIRTPSALTAVSSLSGGNQQKVIVARELSRPIHLLIASQPTRGLDVGSIEYIHKQILKKRDEGVAVLLVSPELDEVLQLSDRVAVMYRGKILTILPIQEVTKEKVGLWMAGINPEHAQTTSPVASPETTNQPEQL